MTAKIARIARYPVKALGPEFLERATLTCGETLADDRAFAVLRRPAAFDPAAPEWLPKSTFFTLMQSERLAKIGCRYDATSELLTLTANGRAMMGGNPHKADGKERIEDFLHDYVDASNDFRPTLIGATAHSFSDTPTKYLSLINLSSVDALAQRLGRPCDPRRFRANIWLDGLAPWAELDWVGRPVVIGGVTARADEPIIRCAATNVCPDSAVRDLNIPDALQHAFGHTYMGIYAIVTGDGDIGVGDTVNLAAGTGS